MHALDTFLAAGQQSLTANREFLIAAAGLGCVLYAEAVAPFYRTTWDAIEMCVRIAFPRVRAADVVQFGAIREARLKRDEKRAAALRG